MKNERANLVRQLLIATFMLAAATLTPRASLGVEKVPGNHTQPRGDTSATDSGDVAKFKATEQLEWDKWILRKQQAAIYRSNSPTLGANQAKVKIVEFFDYNCQYCRKVQPLLQRYLQQNPDIQIILKDAAFLGKDSRAVGKIMIAARKQKNISELHNALMNRKGQTTEAAALEVAGSMGFDIHRLREDAASDGINDSIQETQNLAINLRVKGTPLFIIGHTIISGAHTDLQEKFDNVIDEIRHNGCDVC